MDAFLKAVADVNTAINDFVWGIPVLSLLIFTGILMTILTRVFQISHFGHWMKRTIGSVLKKDIHGHVAEKGTISQFQSLCTALSATVGVGNIAGIALAIISGGPGAIFWMWLAAFFGMMTNYSENVLGIYFRRKNANGEWAGGAMYYLQDGLGSHKNCKLIGRILAIVFSCFAILASFGIGNASQVNTIATTVNATFHIPTWITGIVLVIFAALVIVGGIKRIASVTEKIVPFMIVFYLIGAIVIIISNASLIGPAFASIFSFAFGIRAVGGAALGLAVKSAVTWGFKRGVFSNEAGLGSSVMVHSNSNVKEPVQQGMWGIFEVFADTMIVCTLTALIILTSGLVDLQTGEMLTDASKSVLVTQIFTDSFGMIGGVFITIAILLFAFSTTLGWNHYGTKAWEYLFGTKSTIIYKVIFVLFIMVGATMSLDLAWAISETFNGLMSLPNLIGVITLSPLVMKITKNYVARTFRGSKEAPMLSAYDAEATKKK